MTAARTAKRPAPPGGAGRFVFGPARRAYSKSPRA
jgi:hypothetical protein